MKSLRRLKSWKAWLALILMPLLVVLNRKYTLGLTTADIATIAAGVAAWVLGEAHMDAKTLETTIAKAKDCAGNEKEAGE